MKHTYKILSAILALTLVLTSNIVPAMACTFEDADSYNDGIWHLEDNAHLDENGNPIVVPCDKVATQGYCDIPVITGIRTTVDDFGNIQWYTYDVDNPYYKEPVKENDRPMGIGNINAYDGANGYVDSDHPIDSFETDKPVETAPPIQTVAPQRFADVIPDAWYYDAVNTMGINGILNGYDDGLFHPDDYITEAEMLTVIYRLATTAEPEHYLGDIKHWAADIIHTLNWRTTTTAAFSTANVENADEYANRAEAVDAIIALLKEAGRLHWNRDTNTWSSTYYTQVRNYTEDNNSIPDWDAIKRRTPLDVPEGKWTCHQWFVTRILCAYNFGLVNGVDSTGRFNPAANLTRAEFCQMLYNADITACFNLDLAICGGYVG